MIQFAKISSPVRQQAAPGCRRAIIDRLAETMREMAFAGENVTPETLKMRGFNADVVRRFGEQASEMARRRSIRRVEHA